MGRSTLCILLSALLFSSALSVDPATFWSTYPQCAVSKCLVPLSTPSNCETNDNSCVCTNEAFVSDVAVCLGDNCPGLGDTLYTQYAAACMSNGGYTIALSKTAFLTESKTLTKFLQSIFVGYPTCAINSCLVPLTETSACELNDNNCLCTNETFVSSVAKCIGQKCSSDVSQVYTTYSSACVSNGGYTMALSQTQWDDESNAQSGETTPQSSLPTSAISSGSGESATTTAQSSPPTSAISSGHSSTTTSNTPSPSQSPSSGYTEDQKINLGVGIGVGLPGSVVACGVIWLKCWRPFRVWMRR